MSKTQKTGYWVCPKMTCSHFILFDEPYLPCAVHGEMIRDNEISLQKRFYKWLKRRGIK